MNRRAALPLYALALLLWSLVIGIPNDTVGVIGWLWLGTVAWRAGEPGVDHREFWRDWWPFVLALVVYWLGRGLADQIGTPVHVTMPIRADEWLAGLVGADRTPTEVLQAAWCAEPCAKALPPRWWDTVLTTVYASHFVAALTLGAVLWVRDHSGPMSEWRRWMRRFVTLNFLGLASYAAYPMAPPWMASRDGFLGEVARITGRGWSELDLHRQNIVLHGMANKVAAMPSLHAGFAFLIAFYAIWRLQTRWRWLLLAYPLAMSTALVYFAEHYVIDAVAGAAAALAAIALGTLWERRRVLPRAEEPAAQLV
ncbi:phosphatase PAP2 family protein [Nocardioides pantholopis]|uniref:phosphatase PAP2 family protein n=1 Tax=Nocardioides pantholopis TaxID=2483798 RepID=UPI000F07787B|nr:phosphatase PAP2 family protein [Nocardioides pantholopis]